MIEKNIRLIIFFGLLLFFTLFEVVRKRRAFTDRKWYRWKRNLLLGALDAALVRLVFPLGAVGIAEYAQAQSWGLLNALNLKGWLWVAISVALLDLLIYFQHWVFHRVPLLWRLHKVHHTDIELDSTSAIRFHPIEIFMSMLIKGFFIILLGLSGESVLIFEVILSSMALFNHSNISLPLCVDGFLRRVVVTPDMHRIHHSTLPAETHSNFGFNFSFWDRLFKTYKSEPQLGHGDMELGLSEHRDLKSNTLKSLLKMPFE